MENYFLLVKFNKINEITPPTKTPTVCTAQAIIPIANAMLGLIVKATKIAC